MSLFKVERIIDGNCFEVANEWCWDKQTGKIVRVYGYEAPTRDLPEGEKARLKLLAILLGGAVELTTAYGINNGALICDVYLRGRNIADLFTEYQ
jgi:endonuclease YncB( thermonuclease family)